MPVRRVVANDQVAADRGRVALQRGPLVYCAEWPDNPGGRVRNLMLPDSAKLDAEFRPDLLNGVTVIKGTSLALASDAEGKAIKNRTGLHRDPLLRLGQPRARRDDRLDPQQRSERPPAAARRQSLQRARSRVVGTTRTPT